LNHVIVIKNRKGEGAMNIYLGDLSITEIEKRMGISFPDKLITYLSDKHQDNASNIAKGKWHCFDLPFNMVCGDMEIAQTVYDSLKHLSKDIKKPLQISVNN
jgi:hypothetical protein